MEQIKTLYYERFVQHLLDTYTPTLKAVKPGHCLKITGLAMKELCILLPKLRGINPLMEVYILSETEKGDEYIHATKLIEIRNNPDKAILILVPSNSRTSAEDSYGDATFQNLSASDLQESFMFELIDSIPQNVRYKWQIVLEQLKGLRITKSMLINYLLYLEINYYSQWSWGNGLYLFGVLPDNDLMKDENAVRRRFLINLDKVTSVLANFSMSPSDRIASLPLKKNTIQKDLMVFLSQEAGIVDALSLFENIHDHHSEFNFARMPWADGWIDGKDSQVKIDVSIVPGKDESKELVRLKDTGDYVVLIKEGKKIKVPFNVVTTPTPKDNPDIFSLEISLVRVEDFSEVGVLKKAKIGTNKNAKRKLSINIQDDIEEGDYILRVMAKDQDGVLLDNRLEFKEEQIEAAWQEALKENPNLQREQYRQEHNYIYCNESEPFTIRVNDDEDNDDEFAKEIEKRAKVNTYTQAIIHYRSSHLSKGENVEITSESVEKNKWQTGNLNQTFQFDFGANYAYQILQSRKLVQLEQTFLQNSNKFGCVCAYLTANPTDITLLNYYDTADQKPKFVEAEDLDIPDSLRDLRKDLFESIMESADNKSGLTSTYNFAENIGKVKSYLSEYDIWLRQKTDKSIPESETVSIQNLDTVKMAVEMPDGTSTTIKLITPLHPLRLAWIINLYELYQDWEYKTIENPNYRKAWFRKLDKLFQGELPMEIAPLILTDSSLDEAYQYIGEITFGWGAYAKPNMINDDAFASGSRQLKSYTAMLLNITKDKQIDGDLSLHLVQRHFTNYCQSHPYIDKLVINIFNAGDASIFAKALIELEKNGIGLGLSYEIRLFADDNMLQTGVAFRDLLDPDAVNVPEAEVFSQASVNKLFPKLRFSLNRISDFVNNHDNYQAHISFMVNPFAVHTELVKPNELSRSFFLNGTICRSVVDAKREGKSFLWDRYYSNKILPNPVSESANLEVSIFGRLQESTGNLLSSTLVESVPATELRLKEGDMMLLTFVHDSSDWVVTFDKNMGPEFYDLPCLDDKDVPYLLDYVPSEDTTGVSSYLTTRPTSEIEALMVPLFREYNIELEKKKRFNEILEDIRTVSSSLIMQVNATSRKGFEIIGTALTKRFLHKKHILKEAFLIPIDLHQELFEDLESAKQERADNLVVSIDTQKREFLFTVVEIKCRNSHYEPSELHNKIVNQIQNTILALKTHYQISDNGLDRLDRELKILEFKSFLEFYIKRAKRYHQLDPNVEREYLMFLGKLADGYTIRFKQLGVIFDFKQTGYQKKDFYGDATIYTMGEPVIEMILDDTSTLNTQVLDALKDQEIEFQTFFETRRYNSGTFSNPFQTPAVDKVETVENDVEDIEIPVDTPQAEDMSVVDASKIIELEEPTSLEEPKSKPQVESEPEPEPVADTNYQEPKADVIIGKNDASKQFGVIGKVISNGRVIGMDLDECNTISLFGVQGAGKSYTIGTVTEMVLSQFSNVNKLPAPMASVIFHYSDSMDYAPEFTSMVYPNDEAKQLAKLKAEYGAEPGSINDVILLAPAGQVDTRKSEYPDIEVHSIGFDSSELSVRDWLFLLGATGNDSTYIKELKQIMKAYRNNMSLQNLRNGVSDCPQFSTTQRNLANQRLNFAEEYITDGNKLQQYLKPGRLIIVDLRDEFIEKEEALGLFVVMLNIFSGVMQVDGRAFNKFIVFDEAHKYMNDKELVSSITTAIREMRHKGVSIMIASQDPMSLPTEIIELSSMVVMHRFSSPAWVKHVQKAITPLQTLTATEMASLGSGEAYLWTNKSTDKTITQRPIKISIRPRVTKHGGDTIHAVK